MLTWILETGLSGTLVWVLGLAVTYMVYVNQKDKDVVTTIILPRYNTFISNISIKMVGKDVDGSLIRYDGYEALGYILNRVAVKNELINSEEFNRFNLTEEQKSDLALRVVFYGTQNVGRNPVSKLYEKYGFDDMAISHLSDTDITSTGEHIVRNKFVPDTTFHGYQKYIHPLIDMYHQAAELGKRDEKLFLMGVSRKTRHIIDLFKELC